MPYGFNAAVCANCGMSYSTGDCIVLEGCCGELCRKDYAEKIRKTIEKVWGEEWIGSKNKLKREIQTIMNDALSGFVDIYRLKQDGGSYIRWGLVEKHIKEAIDKYWPKEKENE